MFPCFDVFVASFTTWKMADTAIRSMVDEDKCDPAVCKLCLAKQGKYTCPRCNIRYCSIECYKCVAHGQCSETFYQDCFMQGLKDMKCSESDKTKVLETLERLRNQDDPIDSDDEYTDNEDDLVDRLKGIDLETEENVDEIWPKLTNLEKKEFEAMIADGRLGNLIELWEPWWCEKISVVEEKSAESGSGSLQRIPAINHSIQPVDKLLHNKAPSEYVRYSIINILYGYSFVCRLYNGDYHQAPYDSTSVLLAVSETLGTKVFQDTSSAIQAGFYCVQQMRDEVPAERDFLVAVVDDVRRLLHGPAKWSSLRYVMVALSDIHLLLKKAKTFLLKSHYKDEKADCVNHQASKLALTAARRKIEFLLSWCHKYGLCLSSLVPEVETEICVLTSDLVSHKELKGKCEHVLKAKKAKKVLNKFIEEI